MEAPSRAEMYMAIHTNRQLVEERVLNRMRNKVQEFQHAFDAHVHQVECDKAAERMRRRRDNISSAVLLLITVGSLAWALWRVAQ